MRGLLPFFLSVLTQVSSQTSADVTGFVGLNVTLPCRYDTQAHGVLSFCWGRGEVPRSKCSNTVLSSHDGAVDFRQSSSYQLLGRQEEGDISLTIVNAQWSDAGVYGCRVEIPGWFNDLKVNTHLTMKEAPTEPPATQAWTTAAAGGHEAWTTSAPDNIEDGYRVAIEIGHFKVSLELQDIARTGVIFVTTMIIVLVFIFRRKLQPQSSHHPSAQAVENIYESIPVHDGQRDVKKGLSMEETSG